jgi:hypothetical protein
MLTCPVESLFGKDPDVAEDVVDDKVRYTVKIINRVEPSKSICTKPYCNGHLYTNVAVTFNCEYLHCVADLFSSQ